MSTSDEKKAPPSMTRLQKGYCTNTNTAMLSTLTSRFLHYYGMNVVTKEGQKPSTPPSVFFVSLGAPSRPMCELCVVVLMDQSQSADLSSVCGKTGKQPEGTIFFSDRLPPV